LLGSVSDPQRPEQRLGAVYPSILEVQRRDRGTAWPDARWTEAETQSRALKRPVLAQLNLPQGRYRLVVGADPASYLLTIDLAGTVPWRDWPMDPKTSRARVVIEQGGHEFVVQPGRGGDGGWRFDFRKVLASDSQAFDVVAQRQVGWGELPWPRMAAWTVAVGAVLSGLGFLLRQRTARRRAEELLRLGQVARLNALGELAAGMAHELNQPLTALLANTQAARRLLQEEPPDLVTARDAMHQAALQARRAADVVGRLRQVIERPDRQTLRMAVDLNEAAHNAMHLLEPECRRRQVEIEIRTGFGADAATPVQVLADPIAVEQIVHNLVMNALQALEEVAPGERRIAIGIEARDGSGILAVSDTGPGIAPESLPRVFEPFFSTRADGLGLGLSLCETLATNMGGTLVAEPLAPRGVRLALRLPLA
jgi:signal transduction histidine kinase